MSENNGTVELSDTNESAETLTGAAYVASRLPFFPTQSGVYRMLSETGKVLYVGKAKNLRRRLENYSHPERNSVRIQRMIAQIHHIEIIETATEAEAFLLENDLIKRLKPYYNILLKDDKTFPHILLTTKDEFPQLVKHRGNRTRKGEYFGPFASALAVNETLAILQKAFLLRSCTDNVFKNRTRPCLLHQIKRCSAPCAGKISAADYQKLAGEACAFMQGKRFLARFSKHPADAGVLAVCERLSAGLDKVSPERACEEIRKILNCRKAGMALRAMNQAGILSRWFPEADLDTFDRLSTDCPAARWSILGKSPLYRYLPRESKRRLALFLPAAETPFEAAFLLRNNPLKDAALKVLDARFPETGLLAARNITVPPYPISGKDLTFLPKRFIGKALTAAQDFWIKKQGAPDKAALLEFVKNLNFETNSDQSNRRSG